MRPVTDLDIEKLEILDGSRNRDKTRAAVRIEDLAGILEVLPNLQSKASVGAPTKAEFDALYKDVVMLHQRLHQVARTLGDRIRSRVP